MAIKDYFEVKQFLDSKLYGTFQGSNLNQYNSNPLKLSPTTVDAEIFNEIYQYLLTTDMNTLQRTPSGSIRKGPKYISNQYAYDLRKSSLGIMLTICVGGYLYVLKFGLFKNDEAPEIYPTAAFKYFTEKCLEHGINLLDYEIDNGREVKESTEKPYIDMDPSILNKELTNVHHVDYHSSYPAGLVNAYPEFRPVMEYYYERRKTDKVAKFLMNSGIGFMCTEKFGFNAKLAHLRKAAVEDNNKRLDELRLQLILTGHRIIGHNTDGIWYQGSVYHGPGEGEALGDWSNDHLNCKFRAKSDGAYEFIEDGKYHAVIRGQTSYDSIKPNRDEWEWGDIYRATIIGWKFDNKKGVYFTDVK
jgi:hypothetical protein